MKGVLLLVLFGALGGATNALLCYANIPLKIGGASFRWNIVPMGALHGATLAFIPGLAALAKIWVDFGNSSMERRKKAIAS